MYLYALEWLCNTLGAFLDSFEGRGLQSLKLDTGLTKARIPMSLPAAKDYDCPEVSYLTAEEVRAEAQRLRSQAARGGGGMFGRLLGRNAEREEEREAFVQCLERAAQEDLAVVSFCH
jgi:hypothetical protein